MLKNAQSTPHFFLFTRFLVSFKNKCSTLLQHVDHQHGIKVLLVSREKLHLSLHRDLTRLSKGRGTIASCNKIREGVILSALSKMLTFFTKVTQVILHQLTFTFNLFTRIVNTNGHNWQAVAGWWRKVRTDYSLSNCCNWWMSGNNFVTIFLNTLPLLSWTDDLFLKLTKNLVKWKKCGVLCAFFNMVSWKN